jgi:spore germination cell wall hydrolase CwlJ-like protein
MLGERTAQGILWSMITGLILLGGVDPIIAADDTQKPAKQAPASTAKKAPEKKPAAKSGDKKDTAAAKAKGQPPKYTSAETVAKAQACFGEAPKIQSVTPDEGKAGEKVTIFGKGFGPAACLRSLSFGPGYPAAFTFVSDAQITATVPSGRRKGMAMMTITTASGEDSKGFLLK